MDVVVLEDTDLSDRAFRVSDAMLSFSQELVRADSIPASDLSLSEAKRAEALSSRSRCFVGSFRCGCRTRNDYWSPNRPVEETSPGLQPFPSIPKGKLVGLDAQALTDVAMARRFDRAAALKGIESKRLLAEKARIDMRPDLKLKAGVGVAVIDNSATNSGSGYGLQPEFEVGVGFNFPPANHTKKGALISAQANLDKSILSMETVSRSIVADILVSVDTLKELDEQISDSELSVNYYTKSLSDLRERLRLGAATLLDTIQAEERLKSAATSAVSAKASLAEEIAKLPFEETATLISKDVAYRTPGFPKPVESLKISRTSFTNLPVGNEEHGPLISDRNYEPGHRSSVPETPKAGEKEQAPPSSIFRKAALERLSSPEQLDYLMSITSPIAWIALALPSACSRCSSFYGALSGLSQPRSPAKEYSSVADRFLTSPLAQTE